jgi:hypothetical protein
MGSAVFFGFFSVSGCFGVYIHFCGNGRLWFRFYSGSLLKSPGAGPVKSKQNAFAPPLGASPRLGMPERRHCSVGRHPWPSAANPASMPGCPLRNTFVQPSWLTGRPRSTSTARRPNSRPGSCGRTPIRSVGAKLARDDGVPVNEDVGCAGLFASRLAPTGGSGCT